MYILNCASNIFNRQNFWFLNFFSHPARNKEIMYDQAFIYDFSLSNVCEPFKVWLLFCNGSQQLYVKIFHE